MKVVSLDKAYNFCIGQFLSVCAIFGERGKSSRDDYVHQGVT
jgi:hypothetical protein